MNDVRSEGVADIVFGKPLTKRSKGLELTFSSFFLSYIYTDFSFRFIGNFFFHWYRSVRQYK